MKFNEYPYEHPNIEMYQKQIQEINSTLKNAKSYEEFKRAFLDLDDINRRISGLQEICGIRHTVNTLDTYYKEENDYWNEKLPILQEDFVEAGKIVMTSPFKEQLEQEIPKTYFLQKEMEEKSFSPAIIEDLQTENKLASAYQQLVASAQIEFDGQTYTLAGLDVKMSDKDRDVRKRAVKAYWDWFAENEKELGDIFTGLVKVRNTMAQKLGFENYIELGYLRMNRFDYDQNDVGGYRKQILDSVVPICNELYERQRKRLGYDTLYAWDEKYEFESGNPTPKYDKDELVKRALRMYKQLDPQTGEFFQYMVDHDLLDLEAKPGKAAGGYCTFIPTQNAPFIFSNFNHTSGDVEVLTHEAGHAFQAYCSSKVVPVDCIWPTSESAEIHSMSMEFLTYPWMKDFFEEDTEKYYFSHLSGALKFLPYGVLVDHFQHEVYAHPDMTIEEMFEIWRRLEKQYLPHKNYEEIDVLERGGWWMRQLHIFLDPFYYIDYTLAQVCALQMWERALNKDPQVLEDYKCICKIGGTKTFREIVHAANLKVPFDEGCLDTVMKTVKNYLDEIDDTQF
ncbi:MAG: M3 family oligoendopeptidase [Faecalicoccus sp.]|nr:M3 family oligoendopeptidase [Faecalicoccus sp.]